MKRYLIDRDLKFSPMRINIKKTDIGEEPNVFNTIVGLIINKKDHNNEIYLSLLENKYLLASLFKSIKLVQPINIPCRLNINLLPSNNNGRKKRIE